MKQIIDIVIFGILLILAACQQEELTVKGTGTLLLEDLHVQTPQHEMVETKAVDAELYVRIKNSSAVTQYEPGKVPTSLDLSAGIYQLEIFNEAYNTTSSNAPIYYLSQSFTITAGAINRIEAIVPMTNVGIELVDNLPTSFTDYTLILNQDNVQQQVGVGKTTYCKATLPISYVLQGKNADNEPFTSDEGRIDTPVAGTCYRIVYSLETKSWITETVGGKES